MKTIAYILALYLIFLSGISCADGQEATPFEGQTALYQKSEHSGDDCADDHCSPLCICSCCHIQVNLVLKPNFSSQKLAFIAKNPFSNTYKERFKNRYSESVFRPPIC